MLVLSRKVDEDVMIYNRDGTTVRVAVVGVCGIHFPPALLRMLRVNIGFEADRRIIILRSELGTPEDCPGLAAPVVEPETNLEFVEPAPAESNPTRSPSWLVRLQQRIRGQFRIAP